MDDPLINTSALNKPKNRQLLIIIGVALVALIVMVAIWQNSGTQGAKRELSAATDKYADKQKEVDEARRVLEQKLAELRAVRAEADAKATMLGSEVAQDVQSTVNDARVDLPADARVLDLPDSRDQEFYVRDRDGRFIRVRRP